VGVQKGYAKGVEGGGCGASGWGAATRLKTCCFGGLNQNFALSL
jgi:hypothetical protein